MASVSNTPLPARPWWLMYVRAGFFVLIGLVMLISSQYSLGSVLLLSACLLITGYTAVRFWRFSRSDSDANTWILLNGLLEMLIGAALLFYHPEPVNSIVLIFGFWSVLRGVFQAVETIFLFLGFQDASQVASDFGVGMISFVTFLLSTILAFLLVSQPFGPNSTHYAGILIMLLGGALVVEARRLQADAEPQKATD